MFKKVGKICGLRVILHRYYLIWPLVQKNIVELIHYSACLIRFDHVVDSVYECRGCDTAIGIHDECTSSLFCLLEINVCQHPSVYFGLSVKHSASGNMSPGTHQTMFI